MDTFYGEMIASHVGTSGIGAPPRGAHETPGSTAYLLRTTMRIGQILTEAELISPKQLTTGLEFAKNKGIFVGKAMKLLKFIDEDNVQRALETQKYIRMGLSPVVAVQALKIAVREQISVEQALQERVEHKHGLPPGFLKDEDGNGQVDSNLPAEKLIELGDGLLLDDHCNQAEAHYLAALSLYKKAGEPVDVTPLLNRLGNNYMAMERFDYAKKCYDKVLELRIHTLPEEHLLIAGAMESIADLHKAMGEEKAALETYLKALDIFEKHLPSQLSHYASILRKIVSTQNASAQQTRQQPVGELLIAAGLLTERELQTALKMSKQNQTPLGIVLRENCMVGDREMQSALKAQFCIRQGVLTEELAIDLLTRASRREITLERLLHEAGVVMSDQDKYDVYYEIAKELDRLVAAESSAVSSQQQELAPIAHKLGSLYEQAGDSTQAEIYYSRALKIWGAETRGDLNAARVCNSLAKIHRSQNRPREAAELFARALEHKQHALGNNHEETLETMEDLAETQLEGKNAKVALEHARCAISQREELGQNSSKLFRATFIMGDCLRSLKQYEEAQIAYKKAMTMAQEGFGAASLASVAIIEKLGDLYSEQELFKTAIVQYKFAMVILQGAGKADSAASQKLQQKLAQAEESALKLVDS